MERPNEKVPVFGTDDWKWFLFSFQGRISRKPFWLFQIMTTLPFLLLQARSPDLPEDTVLLFEMAFLIIVMWPSMAVAAKRWHDTGRSALWILINFIPIIGPLWALVVTGFLQGTPGDNRFGPNPLEEQPQS